MDGQPIANVTVTGSHLVHLFVAPTHQKVGLGRHLLALGEAMIAAEGHADFELHTRVESWSALRVGVGAIAFYERAGWTVTDHFIHTVEHGIEYDERVLVKQVDASWCPRVLREFRRNPRTLTTEVTELPSSATEDRALQAWR